MRSWARGGRADASAGDEWPIGRRTSATRCQCRCVATRVLCSRPPPPVAPSPCLPSCCQELVQMKAMMHSGVQCTAPHRQRPSLCRERAPGACCGRVAAAREPLHHASPAPPQSLSDFDAISYTFSLSPSVLTMRSSCCRMSACTCCPGGGGRRAGGGRGEEGRAGGCTSQWVAPCTRVQRGGGDPSQPASSRSPSPPLSPHPTTHLALGVKVLEGGEG